MFIREDCCWKSKSINNSVYVPGPSLFQSQAVYKVVFLGGGVVLGRWVGRRGKQSGKIQGWQGLLYIQYNRGDKRE